MKLRTGKDIYKIKRHFDRFEGGFVAEDMRYGPISYSLQRIPIVELIKRRNQSNKSRKLRGRPEYIAIEPATNKIWLYPIPDRPYDFMGNFSETFQV